MKQTPYDGKKALILKGHPHEDAVALCQGADSTPLGWGLIFKREDTGESFFVFDPKEVQWI